MGFSTLSPEVWQSNDGRGLIIRWNTVSFPLSALFAIAPFHHLNPITWLSLYGCGLCLHCCYPLAPSYFDKLGHENKLPHCQENAKYRAPFLWLWFFNQLPLISALHPLFLSFQNVMEEKSPLCQHPFLSAVLLHCPSLTGSFIRCCVSYTVSIFKIRLATLLIHQLAVSFSSSFSVLSPLCLFPVTLLLSFFLITFLSGCSQRSEVAQV